MAAVSDQDARVSKDGSVPHTAAEAAAWHSDVTALIAEFASKQVGSSASTIVLVYHSFANLGHDWIEYDPATFVGPACTPGVPVD